MHTIESVSRNQRNLFAVKVNFDYKFCNLLLPKKYEAFSIALLRQHDSNATYSVFL